MVSGKLPFKEHQPQRMLHLIRRGPIFRPGLSPGEHHHTTLLPRPSLSLEGSQRVQDHSKENTVSPYPHMLEKYSP